MKKIIIIIAILLCAATAFAEVFVLYDDAGTIVSSGTITREWDNAHRDGSTMLEYIEKQSYKVLYFNDINVPDRINKKVENGKIVSRDKSLGEPEREIDKLKKRIEALENK